MAREKDQGTGFAAPKTQLSRSATRHTIQEGAQLSKGMDGKNSASSRNDQQLGKMTGVSVRVSQEGRRYEKAWNRDKYLGQWAALTQQGHKTACL